jgi:hypothetical protein
MGHVYVAKLLDIIVAQRRKQPVSIILFNGKRNLLI